MQRTGGKIVVECLQAQQVSLTFGVPGESYLHVLDALYDARNNIKFFCNRQEGGAAFMAEAYAKLTGKVGICFVTRGPGATNASIGVHTAMQSSTPMILFIGQINTHMREREAFQEVDFRAFFSPIAKWATEIDHVDRIPETIARAFAVAQSGRPGPVVISLPEDVLSALSDAPVGPKVEISKPAMASTDFDRLKNMFAKAERPLLLLGGNDWSGQGRTDIAAFATRNNIPVATAFRYHDTIDNHLDCYIGDGGLGKSPAMKKALGDADLICAIGVRFGEMTTDAYTLFEFPQPAQTLIHIHSSDDELGKVYQAHLPIHASPDLVAAALGDLEIDTESNWQNWCETGRAGYLKARQAPAQPGKVDMGEIMAYLQQTLPEDVILTNGAGNFSIWPNKFFTYGNKARLLAPQSGAMGYGVPAAIAAKAAYPNRTVICFAGDGDFQMNGQELGAALQEGTQPIILLLNNGTYGTIRMHQERHFPERVSGTDITNPDFVALAKAYGFHAERIDETRQFSVAFERALESKTGALLELVIDPEGIAPRLTISQLREKS